MLSKTSALAAILVAMSAPAFAQGDATDGQDSFQNKCAICHTVDPGGPGGAGPNLNGVVGSKAGSRPGFAYSDAMKGSGLTWTTDNIVKYLQSPATVVPGTKMARGFSGVPADMAADIAAYLATLTGAPAAGATAAAPATPEAATPGAAAPVTPGAAAPVTPEAATPAPTTPGAAAPVTPGAAAPATPAPSDQTAPAPGATPAPTPPAQ